MDDIRSTTGGASAHPMESGKPTVAPNTGTRHHHKNLRGFVQVPAPQSTPEWARLPKPGTRCQYSGLARTTLVELIDRREIRAITVRQPEATRGIRLIHLGSLFAYLARLDAEQNPASENSGPEGQK